jgi:hypothetical protein
LVSHGAERNDLDVPWYRAITGGYGKFKRSVGQVQQTKIGFNQTECENFIFDFQIHPTRTPPAATRPDARIRSPEICLRGRLTDEGVECPALRGPDGRLYTLKAAPGAAPAAGELCVCGWVAELSNCMQGTTIVVTRIGPPDGCP